MSTRNQTHPQQQQQEPAQPSSTAGGFELVGRYLTRTGAVGVEIRKSRASGRFQYMGAWGAGSGLCQRSMRTSLEFMLGRRRGVIAEMEFQGVGSAV